jgi:hypothetical protein
MVKFKNNIMKKILLIFFLFTAHCFGQTIDTTNWQLTANNTDGKYTSLTNRTTYYGLTAGTVKINFYIEISQLDTSKFQMVRNQTDGKYNQAINKVTFYGKDSGTVKANVIIDGSSSIDTSAWTISLSGSYYSQVINRTSFFGLSSGTVRLNILYNTTGSLPVLSPNTGVTWIGEYQPITTASDTANTINGTQWLLMNHSWYRIRQTGSITQIGLEIRDATKQTSFKFQIWRNVNTKVGGIFTLIRTSEELTSRLVNGVNSIVLTTPIDVQAGDYYAIVITGTGNAIAEPMSSSTAFNRSYSSFASDSLNKDWTTGTVTERYFPIRFYFAIAPVMVCIGNSIIDGTMNATTSYRFSSGASHTNYSGYDVTTTLPYKIGTYMNWTYQNMGVASQTSTMIQSRFKTDCIDLSPKICVIEGGINDWNLANHYSAGIIARTKAMIDSCLNHSIVPIVYGISPSQSETNATMQTVDSVNSAVHTYCTAHSVQWINTMSLLGQFRAGGDAGNLWDLKPQFCYAQFGDTLHPIRNANGLIARQIFNQAIKPYWIGYTDSTYQRLNVTTYSDTIKDRLPVNIQANTYNFFATDSLKISIGINSNTPTVASYTMDSVGATNDYWHYSYNPDTSTIANNDTLVFTTTAYGYSYLTGTMTVTNTQRILIKNRTYTVPIDSLKIYVGFDKWRGFYNGISTYQQRMPSLYTDGTNTGDTLMLGATASSSSDDPTDSTAFGFLYLDGSNDGIKTNTLLYLPAGWTMIIKFRGYANGYIIANTAGSNAERTYVYTSTGNTLNLSNNSSEYYANWGSQQDDSATAVTSDGDIYRNGVLRKDNSFGAWTATNTSTYFGTFKFLSNWVKCRIYFIAVYNRVLSQSEIAQWNN